MKIAHQKQSHANRKVGTSFICIIIGAVFSVSMIIQAGNSSSNTGLAFIKAAQAGEYPHMYYRDYGIDYPDIRRIPGRTFYPRSDAGDSTSTNTTDIWIHIRNNFALPDYRDKYVTSYEKWYSSHPKTLSKTLERAKLYLPYIFKEVQKRNMPSEIALLPVIESAFNPYAYSHAHAAGLWQFISSTGKNYGLKQNWWYEGRRDVVESTRAALDYLEDLHEMFDGDWLLALAAYNGGENRIRREREKNRTEFHKMNLRMETRKYVPKLLAVKNIVADPESFGITLTEIKTTQNITVAHFSFQIDLQILADAIHCSLDELALLNPGLRRSMTPPNGPYRVLVPADKYYQAAIAMYNLNPADRYTWVSHLVKTGDSLGEISSKYGVPIKTIMDTNTLTNANLIQVGERLIIPTAFTLPSYLSRAKYSARKIGVKHIHRVKPGDNLWHIAKRYNVKVTELYNWNAINNDGIIHPNQNIILYLD